MSRTLFETDAGPTIKAIAPWFGGKRTMAPSIVREIGKHQVYWELCSGSLAVLFAKEPCREETIVDLHGDATNLTRVLASSQWWELCDRVERTTFSDELFEEAKSRLEANDPDELNRAYDYLVASWMGLNGVSGTAKTNTNFAVRYTSNGGSPAKRWRGVGESIPWWHKRLASVGILRRDIFTVAERIEDKEGTAIYVDPPYVQKSHKYEHDFDGRQFLLFGDGRLVPREHCTEWDTGPPRVIDAHEALAVLLRRFTKTRVVVSYYQHERLAEWYPGWSILPVKATKGLVSSGMRDKSGATDAPEVLIVNGPLFGT